MGCFMIGCVSILYCELSTCELEKSRAIPVDYIHASGDYNGRLSDRNYRRLSGGVDTDYSGKSNEGYPLSYQGEKYWIID